jgi:uncharacterized DUF497 family protein
VSRATQNLDRYVGYPYIFRMLFEWDDVKAASNVVKHGVTFEEAIQVFDDPRRAVLDTFRFADRESRFKAIGVINSRLITVVFTERGTARRMISARRANASEERLYGDSSLHT